MLLTVTCLKKKHLRILISYVWSHPGQIQGGDGWLVKPWHINRKAPQVFNIYLLLGLALWSSHPFMELLKIATVVLLLDRPIMRAASLRKPKQLSFGSPLRSTNSSLYSPDQSPQSLRAHWIQETWSEATGLIFDIDGATFYKNMGSLCEFSNWRFPSDKCAKKSKPLRPVDDLTQVVKWNLPVPSWDCCKQNKTVL